MSDYLGPAGIFSTDDPAADQRQIEAEQWDEEEDYEYSSLKEIHACCGCHSCTFWGLKWIEDTPESIDEQSKLWQEKHAATGCKDELIISNI